MSSKGSEYALFIKELAMKHGFMGAGIARAEHMDDEAKQLEEWLNQHHHGEMAYMANHFDLRVDPTKLVPGAKSVISLLYNYYPGEIEAKDKAEAKEKVTSDVRHADVRRMTQHDEDSNLTPHVSRLTEMNHSSDAALPSEDVGFNISRYAYGEDYHKVVRRKLKALVSDLKKEIGDFHARVFVDSAPVMERDWAKRSGQGWIGKNTLLIHPKKGSYFFLAEIILDVELEYDQPMRDHCGTCTKCIDACPTDAISPEGYILDGSKCISYLTIELKHEIPSAFKGQMENWIFGCDICQEVCPWNRFSTPHQEPAFERSGTMQEMNRNDWLELTEELFDDLFSRSAVKRAGYEGLMRNIRFLSPANH
jgi:epoxyqueuosine reductase